MFREDRLKGKWRLAKDKMITHRQNSRYTKDFVFAAGGMYRGSVVRFVRVCKAVPPSEYASTRDVWVLSFVVE
jgi:hypothetical protein